MVALTTLRPIRRFGLLVLLLLTPATPATAAPRVTPSPSGVLAGEPVTVAVKGLAGTPRFTLGARPRGGSAVIATRGEGGWRIVVPRSTPFGTRFLRACSGGTCAVTTIGVIARGRPLTARPVLSGDAASATIGRGGGTLTAFDGARSYVLTIPKGALAVERTIKMTPIGALEDAPLSGGFRGGVQLEPDGLTLLRPAKLRIAAEDLPRRVAAVAYDGAGENVRFLRGRSATLRLTHFSGYGVGTATAADRRTAAAHPPEGARAQAEAAMSPDPEAALDAWLYGSVLPKLESAEPSDQAILRAIDEAVSWAEQVRLTGFAQEVFDRDSGPFAAETRFVLDQIEHLLHVAQARALRRCATNNDPVEFGRWERLAAYRRLLIGTALDELLERARQCLRFEVDAEVAQRDNAVDAGDDGAVGYLDARGRADSILVEFSPDRGATGTLPAWAFSDLGYRRAGCSGGSVQPGAQTEPVEARLEQLQYPDDLFFQPVGPLSGRLVLAAGNPSHQITATCPNPGGEGTGPNDFVTANWGQAFPGFAVGNGGTFSFGPQPTVDFPVTLTSGGAAFSATWTLQPAGKPTDNPELQATLSVAIRHVPDPQLLSEPTGERRGSEAAAHQRALEALIRRHAARRRAEHNRR